MKKLFLYILSFCTVLPLFSQDRIFTRKEVIHGKVTDVEKDFVKYKKADNPDGPKYNVALKLVDSIQYANGVTDVFRRARPISPAKALRVSKYRNLGDNLFFGGYFVSDINEDIENMMKGNTVNGVYASYERFLLKQRIGLTLSGYAGIGKEAYGGSFSAMFYPLNSTRFRMGMGPEYILMKQDFTEPFYVGTDYAYVYRKYETTLSSMAFSTRLQYHWQPKVCILSDFSVGNTFSSSNRKKKVPDDWRRYNSDYDNMYIKFRIGIGYRF
ncbi:MAG: hypothetical protein QM727_01640 [Niabella sp.]